VLAGQEFTSSKDGSSKAEDGEVDVLNTRRDKIRNEEIWDKVGDKEWPP